MDFFTRFVYYYIRCIIKLLNKELAEKKWTFSPSLFTSILQVYSILVNDKVAEKKWAFLPDCFTSILDVYSILVNDKLAEKKIDFFARLFYYYIECVIKTS